MSSPFSRLQEDLTFVYGSDIAAALLPQIEARLAAFRGRNPGLTAKGATTGERFSQRDALLITYGDQVQEPGKPPLQSLGELLIEQMGGVLTGVHILPFYPWTSDDGFSVQDYTAVDPALGRWADVTRLSHSFKIMFDAVINHISAASDWFQGFLADQAPYKDYFVTVDPSTDLSQVVRPRTLPLLTEVETAHGPAHVWTTFSADQIDLNFANPDLFLEILDVLLLYVEQGASLIRLDAIAFMWKEIGTSCLHLPQTHRLIQAMRAALDAVSPQVLLITETNVPHAENISYFGDGQNEAQLVYNFTLPPLTLHAFATGNATHLQKWAASLSTPSATTTYFNFMASHDGIGVRPVEGILDQSEVKSLAERVEAHGGFVSYRNNPDGSQSPYELNITYYDALNNPAATESQRLQVDRFMASQAILLGLAGMPGIYAHSLFGSRNWREGVAQTGRNRTINRQKFDRATLEAQLADPACVRSQVFKRYKRLLAARIKEAAFHPNGGQTILQDNPALFSFVRTAPDGSSQVLCIHNVTEKPQTFKSTLAVVGFGKGGRLLDLVSGAFHKAAEDGTLTFKMAAYCAIWLKHTE